MGAQPTGQKAFTLADRADTTPPAQQIVLQEKLQTIEERIGRLERLDNELTHHVHQWRYYPVVKAVQAMRGVRLLVAVGVIAELGDLQRFDHPRRLMAYLGLVPSEHSSGAHRRLGAITKCGNGRARRLFIEGTHSYRYPANVSKDSQLRQEGYPKTSLISPGKLSSGSANATSAWLKQVNTTILLSLQ